MSTQQTLVPGGNPGETLIEQDRQDPTTIRHDCNAEQPLIVSTPHAHYSDYDQVHTPRSLRRSSRTPSKPSRFASETHLGSVKSAARKRERVHDISNQARKRRRQGGLVDVLECSFVDD